MLQDVVESCVWHTPNSEYAIGKTQLPSTKEPTIGRLHRDFVRSVVKKTGKKPTRIAMDLNIAPSTLTRVLNQPDDGQGTLSAKKIALLERYSGLAAPKAEAADDTKVAGLRDDATPFDEKGASPTILAAIKAISQGGSSIEVWTMQSRALECDGYLPGDTVIVDLKRQSKAGDAVCAIDRRGGSSKTLMRLHQPPFLVSATFDPTLRKPIQLNEDEYVLIRGVILPYRLGARA